MLSSGGLRARSSILAKVILGTTCLRTGIALQAHARQQPFSLGSQHANARAQVGGAPDAPGARRGARPTRRGECAGAPILVSGCWCPSAGEEEEEEEEEVAQLECIHHQRLPRTGMHVYATARDAA